MANTQAYYDAIQTKSYFKVPEKCFNWVGYGLSHKHPSLLRTLV